MSPFFSLRPLRPALALQLFTALAALILLPPLLTAVPEEARPRVLLWASAAVLFDLTLSAVGLGWLLRGRLPFGLAQVGGTLLLGLALGGAALPEWRGPLWVAAGMIGAGAFLRSRRPTAALPEGTPLERRTARLARFLPAPLAASLAHDALLWPGLRRREVEVPSGAQVFTTHLKAGRAAYIWLYVFSEIPLHLGIHAALAPRGDEVWAALLTAADLGFTLWLVALARSFARHPLAVVGERLWLQQGLLWSGSVPLEALEGLRPGGDAAAIRLTLTTAPNLTLSFREEVTLRGPLGLTRRGRAFSLFVDDPAALARALAR